MKSSSSRGENTAVLKFVGLACPLLLWNKLLSLKVSMKLNLWCVYEWNGFSYDKINWFLDWFWIVGTLSNALISCEWWNIISLLNYLICWFDSLVRVEFWRYRRTFCKAAVTGLIELFFFLLGYRQYQWRILMAPAPSIRH